MRSAKIAVSMDEEILDSLDRMVKRHVFPNRSRAVQAAVKEKLERLDRNRLARECAKLDFHLEKKIAEEGFAGELAAWPEY